MNITNRLLMGDVTEIFKTYSQNDYNKNVRGITNIINLNTYVES